VLVFPAPPAVWRFGLIFCFIYYCAKIQAAAHLEVQLKKQARQFARLEAQLARTAQQLTAREKECALLKDHFHKEEAAHRAAEASLERERMGRLMAQQKVDELLGNRAAEREREAELVKAAIDHPEVLHVLTDDKRKNIQQAWERLDMLEKDLVHLSTSAILMAPFGDEAEQSVKRELSALKDKILDQGDRHQKPKQPFQMSELLRRVRDVLRDATDFPDVQRALKEFCQFCQVLDKSIADTQCLPRDELLQHIRKPLEVLHNFLVLATRKKYEERDPLSLHGLDAPSTIFSKTATTDKVKRHHEATLRKYEERESSQRLKVLKMEELGRDLGRLLEGLGELDEAGAELQKLRTSFEQVRTESEEEDKRLKSVLSRFVTEHTEPATAVLNKRRQKEEEITRLRHGLRQKQLDIQEDFLRLLHAEETVACIKREMDFMERMRGHLEVDIARLREEAQSRVEGMEGGVMLSLKEQRLAAELKAMLQEAANQLRGGTVETLGHTHELNYQIIQRHQAVLEAYYTDVMQLLQYQRQQLAEEEAVLAGGGPKTRGVAYYFMSQDRALHRQHDVVQRRRQDIIHTHELLNGVKEKFCTLYRFSNALRVAESLAKYDKAKYGALLSTNTMQDPIATHTWPELSDVLPPEVPIPPPPPEDHTAVVPNPPPDR